MITKQLTKWRPRYLSLAGRILIANQVILAAIWYLCSCASVSAETFKKVQGIVRNYTWGAKTGKQTRAKIRWDYVIQPITEGGAKVIDPALQSSALLTKLIIRALQPGYNP